MSQGRLGWEQAGKFAKPKVGVDETTEKWEDFQTSWVTECKHFTLDNAKLHSRIKELTLQYQNPAVYVQEFLDMTQQPDEGVRHYLSRGVATLCQLHMPGNKHLTRFQLVAGLVNKKNN